MHHAYAHHSFTGNETFDPDTNHFRPLVAKYKNDKHVIEYFRKRQEKVVVIIGGLLPGLYVGQMWTYFVGAVRGRIWGLSFPKNVWSYLHLYEVALMLVSPVCLWYGGFLPAMIYVFGVNITYHINIAPDHDTYECSIENKEEGKTLNWVQMQYCHSGNFITENWVWTQLFGGINFQIEHHIVPNMSHMHYREIQPIVEKFARKKGYPYVSHKTLWGAYKSFLKMIREVAS